MQIEFDKIYTYDLTGTVSFGDLPLETIVEILTDGRIASHFLERQLERWFPELTFVNAKGYDHLDAQGAKYDQKCFTKGGLRFMPSSMIGAGRKLDEAVARDHAKEINYICCDIVSFPVVKVVFKTGIDLVEQYPKCTVPFKNRSQLFE